MTETKPAIVVGLKWNGNLQFTATYKGHSWTLDGRNEEGPSPVIQLASAMAACMAIDVVHILTKGRHKIVSLDTEFTGRRAETDPKRYTRIELLFKIQTNAPLDAVERAIDLSHEKYCSVWHSMRQDIEFHTAVEAQGLGAGG